MKWKFALSIFWLVFTVCFAGWWFLLERENVDRLAEVDTARAAIYTKEKRMIVWEGISWEILLITGGGTLIYLVSRENRRHLEIKEFFASFSHEVKTSLASLRLQAEALKEDLGDQETPLLGRLISDTVRLQLQLENSLYFSAEDSMALYLQEIDVSQLLKAMTHQWPMLAFEIKGELCVKADERALRSVFSNLVQNAIVHGNAKLIKFELKDHAVHFVDDGEGFKGSPDTLGRIFHRPTATSGSGLGLYIARALLEKMGGGLVIHRRPKGFGGEINFGAA